jgi:CTP:molybdopterin cytidylyltransferase MocA
MTPARWDALILAAGRQPEDPFAGTFGVSHKCLMPVAGRPMLSWVIAALQDSGRFERISVSIEHTGLLSAVPRNHAKDLAFVPSESSAAASVAQAFQRHGLVRPVLVTTGDHPLLTPEMLLYFLDQSAAARCDLAVGLATDETVLAAYPGARRTFIRFGRTRVSGCNLFAFASPASLKALPHWQFVERHRKQPWRLVSSFGVIPLLAYLIGALSLDAAFRQASRRLDVVARPILMPFAEAAVDVDRREDFELVERILKAR